MSAECNCTRTVAARIESVFQALPADSVSAIAASTGIDRKDVENALAHLRAHSVEHGWTVPHARRGRTAKGQDRFFAMLVEADGTYIDAGTRASIKDGSLGTLIEASAKLRNEARGWRAVAEHERNTARRQMMHTVAEDAEYFARKAEGIARDLAAV